MLFHSIADIKCSELEMFEDWILFIEQIDDNFL